VPHTGVDDTELEPARQRNMPILLAPAIEKQRVPTAAQQ
jgi:hypothetical protein